MPDTLPRPAPATRESAPPLLDVAGLRYAYGDRRALDGLSFSLRAGEILGLLGPNGAGKTTAVSCLAGLLAPQAGTLAFRGAPFTPRRDATDRARLGLVPQELALYDGLTAAENLRFFARLQRVSEVERAVATGLSLAGLAPRAGDRVASFSGGMKRRLNLAVALVHAPELTLLDEPTVGVDPQSRQHLYGTLEQLRAAGHAMLLTSHSMDEVERLCDRIVIMDHGRLVAAGTLPELAALAGLPGRDLQSVFLALTGHGLRDEEG